MSQRIIVITGATRGLGRALLDHFIPQGHAVFGCGRSTSHVEQLRTTFPKGDFVVVDVADFASVERWAEGVLDRGGPPDLLINNAAVMNDLAPLWEVPTTEFDELIDINIKGVANVIRAFVPAMVEREAGVIVNLSSGWGRSTSPEVAPYCASKYAIEGLTKSLAQELPKGMAAIPLNPGVIDTDMLRSAWGADAGELPERGEMGHQGSAVLAWTEYWRQREIADRTGLNVPPIYTEIRDDDNRRQTLQEPFESPTGFASPEHNSWHFQN